MIAHIVFTTIVSFGLSGERMRKREKERSPNVKGLKMFRYILIFHIVLGSLLVFRLTSGIGFEMEDLSSKWLGNSM